MSARATEMVGWRAAWVVCWVVGSWTVAAAAQDRSPPNNLPTLTAPQNAATEKPAEAPVLLAADDLTPPPPAADEPPPPADPQSPGTFAAPPPGAEEAPPGQEGVEVLTRGPVHEAFAEPLATQPEPTMIIPKKPPEDVEEVPPELKPEGDSIIWIPGYWAWDDDRKDFLWVSGIWRNLPPGRRWVPGYWTEVEGGYQWVPGLWVPVQQEDLQYREAPPQTLEAGPSSPAPSENHFWVPGSWLWYDTGYRWRPGFWSPYQEDWVWVPAHWVWTPSGYLFVPGYWDYRVPRRGRLFAPVCFRPGWWTRPGFYYTPWCTLDVGPLFMHFWIRPRYRHYYFGDYYGPAYLTAGFTPWCRWHSHPHHWDPLLTHSLLYYRHREHFDYVARMQQWHSYYDKHHDFRPPRTYHDQLQFMAKHHGKPPAGAQLSVMGVPLVTIAKRPDSRDHFVTVDKIRRDSFRKEAEQLRQLTKERAGMEKQFFSGSHPGSKIGHDLSKIKPGPGAKADFKIPPTTKLGPGAKMEVTGRPRPGGKLTLPKVTGTTAAAAAKVVISPKTGTFPKLTTQPKTGTSPKVKSEPKTGTFPKVTTEPKTGTSSKLPPAFKIESRPKVTSGPGPGTSSKTTPQFKIESRPKVTSGPGPGTSSKTTPQFKIESRPKVPIQPRTETQPRVTPRPGSGFKQPAPQPRSETPRVRDSGSSRSATSSSRGSSRGRDNDDDSRSRSGRRGRN